MNIFPSGLACEDDSEANKESKLDSCVDEKNKREKEISGVLIMDFEQQHNNNNNNNSNGFEVENEEVDFEIWPVEHPMEPPDEDRPVKCPMPESSVINVSNFLLDEGKREKRLAESLRKRAEESAANKQGKEASGAVAGRPVLAVRKRHHTLTGGDVDHVMAPLTRMPPLPPPLPAQNLNIFQMLQQLDKFES